MIEILTSDPAIVLFAGMGLAATGLSILRDARTQRRRRLTLVPPSADAAATEPIEAAA